MDIENFKNTIKIYLDEIHSTLPDKCNDQKAFVASYNSNASVWEVDFSSNRMQKQDNGEYVTVENSMITDKKIVIILESPHVNEFNGKGLEIQPANSTTGDNIKEKFDKILEVLLEKNEITVTDKFDIYLVNAVQFQCSLGIQPLPTTIRDDIFKKIWVNGGKENFIGRLIIDDNFPDIIINCCTGGITKLECKKDKFNSEESLNVLVSKALDEKYNEIAAFPCKYFYSPHPSSAHFGKLGYRKKDSDDDWISKRYE